MNASKDAISVSLQDPRGPLVEAVFIPTAGGARAHPGDEGLNGELRIPIRNPGCRRDGLDDPTLRISPMRPSTFPLGLFGVHEPVPVEVLGRRSIETLYECDDDWQGRARADCHWSAGIIDQGRFYPPPLHMVAMRQQILIDLRYRPI